MSEYTFKVNTAALTSSDCFREASKEELKVLLAIICSKSDVSIEKLADTAGVSVPRTKAAITLFEECGIIAKDNSNGLFGEVIYEFENKKKTSDRVTESALEAAKSIRDNDLYELQRELEKLLGKTLSTFEIGNLTALYTSSGLSPQYILLLASHLCEVKTTVKMTTIIRKAEELLSSEIDTLEELERYIEEKSKEVKGEAEMRTLLGIHGRTLTPTERKYFARWLHEFGYSSVIIGEAYDICVASTGNRSLKFMDTVLKAWHDGGCKTVDECRMQHEQHKENNKQKKPTNKKTTTKEAETPKYAEFDSEDALMRALERSYGAADNKK